jgi:hypothetical protein
LASNSLRILEALVRDVVVWSEGLAGFVDEAPEMALSELTIYPNESRTDPLVQALTERLYARHYCRRKTPREALKATPDDLIDQLRSANGSEDCWHSGWEYLGRDEHGNALIRSGYKTRLADPGSYREEEAVGVGDAAASGAAIAAGARVVVFRPREDVGSQPDYYYALGQSLGDRYEELVGSRIYLNIRPEGAHHWVRVVSCVLNRYSVPFAFKILRHRHAYGRVDTGVLYIPRRYAGFTAALMISLSEEAAGIHRLRRATPALTRRLAPGLAFADNPPGGESFGISRMRMVAHGIVEAWRAGKVDVRARLESVRARFHAAGVRPDKPWLNPGNAEVALPPVVPSIHSEMSSKWLEVADRIGCQIVRDALWYRNECTWLGWSVAKTVHAHRVVLSTVGADLYSGSAGIALFLAQLASATGDVACKTTAQAAFRYALRASGRGRWALGAYAGICGLLHAASVLASSLGDEVAIDAIPSLVAAVRATPVARRGLDVIEGKSGAIRLLLLLARTIPIIAASEDAQLTAVTFGQELLNELQTQARSRNGSASQALLGFAHGAIGIASALMDLHRHTGHETYRLAAQHLLDVEWSAFDPHKRNWPDRRGPVGMWDDGSSASPTDATPFMTAWCSGAPGVALALLPYVGPEVDPTIRRYFDAAIDTTCESISAAVERGSPSQSFCLCHGIAGNATILLEAAGRLAAPALAELSITAAHEGARMYSSSGQWPCGIRNGGQTPGLMVGLSGIGHFYLRLADPNIAPVLY